MREILFRGKQKNNGEWVYGFYAYIESDERHVIIAQDTFSEYGGLYYYTVDPDTVGQYIDLNDMHGNKIFEGDIVLGTGGLPWLIAFEKNSFVCKDSTTTTYFALWEQWDYNWNSKEDISPSDRFEVIGNIHDNPELLKF